MEQSKIIEKLSQQKQQRKPNLKYVYLNNFYQLYNNYINEQQ